MEITILCVGRAREKYWTEAIAEYSKRLGRYCRLQILEAADEPAPENASEAERAKILEKEGERVLENLRRCGHDPYVIALAIDGRSLDSPGLARTIDELGVRGVSHIVFVIGGSLGLSPQVLSRADMRLSFSAFTFPHQLMRVILLEQIYRAFRIIRGEPYHK